MVIKQGIILLLLFCIGTISSSTCPSTAPIKCSTGICVDSTSKCPIDISCPDDYFRINLYTCSKSEDFRVPSKCETDSECWDGTCQDDPSSKCPTMNTCPSSYNVRCPDNSCVSRSALIFSAVPPSYHLDVLTVIAESPSMTALLYYNALILLVYSAMTVLAE